VITPETLPTEDQLVNFIQRDPNAQGILNAELSGAPGPCRLFPPASLSGATAEFLATDAFAGPHVAVCVTYLKKLEGDFVRETMPSPVGICPINAGFRVAVTVTRDTVSAFAADYDAMRIYIADLASPLFNISPEYYGSFYRVIDVPNATGTYEITPSMQDASTILSTEARIPPPCSMFILANSRITMSGNAAFPMRYWFTKQISTHEPLPEGLGIYDYINLPAETVNDAIVALGEYRGQGVAYTKTNAYPLETGTITHFAVKYGAVNSAVIANWSNGAQYFLARDYNIYTLTQPVTDAKADLPDFNLPLPQISDYIQRFCDTTDSQFAHSIVDALNKNWWLWLKGAAGNMQSFCINMETAELTGPFDFPQFISATYFQNGDTKLVGQDMAGNLFVMDFAQTLDTSERYDNDSGITLHPPTDAADPTMDGYGIAIVPDANGNPQYVERAQIMRVQTPWNNCGDPDLRKGFYSVEWQVVDGSSGLVTIVAINEKGQQVSRYYGDVFGKNQPHRVLMRLKGNQLQFMLIVIVGDNKPFALRNITVNYEPLGPT
jgi:hypothetical protein